LRVPDRGEQSYPGDDGTGARSNGGEDDADGGENVGLAQQLLLVTWNPVSEDLSRMSELIPLLVQMVHRGHEVTSGA
jgi:hypothetical protein